MRENCYLCDGDGLVGINNCSRCGGSGTEPALRLRKQAVASGGRLCGKADAKPSRRRKTKNTSGVASLTGGGQ